jgi:hypothetical protein
VSSLSDGWKRLADNAKSFDADYMEQVKRIESGQASAQEIFQSQIKSKIADLKDKRIHISPENGGVFIASDSGELWDVQTMNAGLNQKADKVDLYGDVNKYVKMLGTGAKVDPVTGKYAVSETLVSDWNKKTKPRIIESILSNPQKAASVLADHSDMGYTFVDDPKKQGGKNILIARDENGIWTPQLTKEQEKQAEKLVGEVVDSQVSYKQEKPDELSFEQRMALKMASSKSKEDSNGSGNKNEDLYDRYRVVTSLSKDPNNSEYTGEIINAPFPANKDYALSKVTWVPQKRLWNYQFLNMKEPDLEQRYKNRKSIDYAPESAKHQAFLNDLINYKKGEKTIGWSKVLQSRNSGLNATAIKKGK